MIERLVVTAALVTGVAVMACGGAEGAPAHPLELVRRLDAGDSMAALERPAAFSGPSCVGCPPTATTLVLHPDGSYRRRDDARANRVNHAARISVGRWTLSRDSVPVLALLSDTSVERFELRSELRLRLVESDGRTIDSARAPELLRVSAPPVLPGRLEVVGEFRDFADAATFTTCTGGRVFPVAGNEPFLRLQREHREHPLGDGAATNVRVIGRLELLPGGEEGTRVESVVVDSFAVLGIDAECQAMRVRALVVVGDWVLTAMDGEPLGELPVASRPTLRMVVSENQMFGNAGCNRFTGRVALRGLHLLGAPVALTRRACTDSVAMARESRYAQILSAGGWFRLDDGDLVLAVGGRDVARFRRR